MKKFTYIFMMLIFALTGIPRILTAQTLKTGDKAPDFNLKSTSGKMVSLSDLKENKGAIIIFTCNNCPFSIAYEDRIIDLHNRYASKGFPVIAINPNDAKKVPEDSYRNMIKRAKSKKFHFEYIHDETQRTARNYGATRTPHVFIVVKESEHYTIKYIGAIDNNTDDPSAADKKFVENALAEILEGKEVNQSMTKAIGCTIKWRD